MAGMQTEGKKTLGVVKKMHGRRKSTRHAENYRSDSMDADIDWNEALAEMKRTIAYKLEAYSLTRKLRMTLTSYYTTVMSL